MTAPCPDGVCVTCADQALPARVTKLLPRQLALVETGSGLRRVSVALVTAEVGDTVLVHAGEAIAVVTDDG